MVSDQQLRNLYDSCFQKVISLGWSDDIDWSRWVRIDDVDRVEFFKQYAFCVFVSFFRWKVINKKWPDLTRAFKGWDYEEICRNKQEVEQEATRIFANKRKVWSVLKCAELLSNGGWDKFKASLINGDLFHQLKQLDALPGIGTAAKYQLAGAIGIDVAKPDRYLLRLASQYGFPATEQGVQNFAKRVAGLVGERVKVVDYVFWRCLEGSRKDEDAV